MFNQSSRSIIFQCKSTPTSIPQSQSQIIDNSVDINTNTINNDSNKNCNELINIISMNQSQLQSKFDNKNKLIFHRKFESINIIPVQVHVPSLNIINQTLNYLSTWNNYPFIYNPIQRQYRVNLFRLKRNKLLYGINNKRILYKSRQNVARTRIRNKGRFITIK